MTPALTAELHRLLRELQRYPRSKYSENERYVVLPRWGGTAVFAELRDAMLYARGYAAGPPVGDTFEPPFAFVVDTDPEFASGTLIISNSERDGIDPVVDLREQIGALYSQVFDQGKYAENLVLGKV